jgi:hypothetical protein
MDPLLYLPTYVLTNIDTEVGTVNFDIYIYIYIYIIYLFNCIWFDTRWQQYSTHLHTNCTQNTENGTCAHNPSPLN